MGRWKVTCQPTDGLAEDAKDSNTSKNKDSITSKNKDSITSKNYIFFTVVIFHILTLFIPLSVRLKSFFLLRALLNTDKEFFSSVNLDFRPQCMAESHIAHCGFCTLSMEVCTKQNKGITFSFVMLLQSSFSLSLSRVVYMFMLIG